MARQIELTNGMVALVSNEDFKRCVERVNMYGRIVPRLWHFDGRYAVCNSGIRGKKIYLHRFVLGLTDGSVHTDHLNEDKLDCRRENLAITTETAHKSKHMAKMRREIEKGEIL